MNRFLSPVAALLGSVLLVNSCGGDLVAGVEGSGSPVAGAEVRSITGLINDVDTSATIAIGSARITTAGAAIYVDGAPGTSADVRANLVATILGKLDSKTFSGPAQSVFLHTATTNGQIPAVRLGVIFAPNSAGNWYMFDGPEFSVSPNASVMIDGEPVSTTGLAIDEGEVVLLSGVQTFDAAHNPGGLFAADRLEIVHLVDAPIDTVDATHSRLTVLGQTVLVNGATCVEVGCPVDNLLTYTAGARVTVSGFLSAAGEIVATRLAPSASSGDLLVTGFVRSLDTNNHQFSVGGLLVNYAGAALNNFTAGSPANGDRLTIRGTRVPGDSVLTATSLTYLAGALPGADGSIATLHAVVTAAVTPSSITVDGHPVRLTNSASQALAACPTALALNRDVTIDGELLADGTLMADFSCPVLTVGAVGTGESISGSIDSIDPLAGTLSVLGFSIQPSITTQLVGASSLGSLRVGDYVLADLNNAPVAGSWNTSRLQRTGSGPSRINVFIYHFSVADPLIYIAGRAISTNGSTTFHVINNTNHAEVPLARATFFAGPKFWPFYDKICTPSLMVTVAVQSDGSLIALDALVEPDYC